MIAAIWLALPWTITAARQPVAIPPETVHDSRAFTTIWKRVPDDGLEVAGSLLTIRGEGSKARLFDGERSVARLSKLPGSVDLKRRLQGKRTVYRVILKQDDAGLLVASATGIEVRGNARLAWVLDLDLDGEFLELREDGLLHASSGTVGTFDGLVCFPELRVRLEVVEGESRMVPVEEESLEAASAANLLGFHRQVAGLPGVEWDPSLDEGCARHAEYVLMNWNVSFNHHTEDPENAYHTAEGARAAAGSLFGYDASLPETVVSNLDIVYHRRGLLQPGLRRIGFGSHSGTGPSGGTYRTPGRINVLDVFAGLDASVEYGRPIPWPAAGQSEVPLEFNGLEQPFPLPPQVEKQGHGYPITLLFDYDDQVEQAELRLFVVDEDQETTEVPGWSFGPGAELQSDGTYAYAYRRNSNIGHFISESPLEPKTTYRAVCEFTIRGRADVLEWSFRTGTAKSSPLE